MGGSSSSSSFEREREREKEREKIFVELFIGGKKVFVVFEKRENNCVYIFFVSFCPPFFLSPLKRTL